MANIYQCNCGQDTEIPENHSDNNNITATGIVYVDECEKCNHPN